MELALHQSVDQLSRHTAVIRGRPAETVRGNNSTCLPDYLLPRVSPTHRPRLVLCDEHARLVGVVQTETHADRRAEGLGGWEMGPPVS